MCIDMPLGRTTTFDVGLDDRDGLLLAGGDITGGIDVTEIISEIKIQH